MRPYGRKQHQHNKVDNHPSKGWLNWWEVEIPPFKSKKRERQQARKCIVAELNEIRAIYFNGKIK